MIQTNLFYGPCSLKCNSHYSASIHISIFWTNKSPFEMQPIWINNWYCCALFWWFAFSLFLKNAARCKNMQMFILWLCFNLHSQNGVERLRCWLLGRVQSCEQNQAHIFMRFEAHVRCVASSLTCVNVGSWLGSHDYSQLNAWTEEEINSSNSFKRGHFTQKLTVIIRRTNWFWS